MRSFFPSEGDGIKKNWTVAKKPEMFETGCGLRLLAGRNPPAIDPACGQVLCALCLLPSAFFKRLWVTPNTCWVPQNGLDCAGHGMVESERQVNGQISDVEQRYYILSLECDVKQFADAVRHHHLY